jgi:pimeloyl-ACP methyl ester carboxylesterase
MTEPARKTMSLSDGDVSYLDWNSDRPLLHFTHATGFNAETYRGLLTPLQGRFHVTAADMRGHGFTTLAAVPGPLADWTTFGNDLARILDRVGSGPAVLAGHSMGAITSLMVASKHPERVRGLVLVEPVLVPRFARLKMRLERLLGREPIQESNLAQLAAKRRATFPSFEIALTAYRGRGAFKTWSDETIADYLRGGLIATGNGTEVRLACTPAWESSVFQHAPPGIARLARQVRCPLTLIYSAGGTAREEDVQIVARGHGSARLLKVPDTTHFLPMERPDIVCEEIDRIALSDPRRNDGQAAVRSPPEKSQAP